MAATNNSQVQRHLVTVWQSLNKCLPPQEPDIDFWWQLTGYHLANMVKEADYSIERQFETLLFHYHWIVPRLGPAPGPDGRAKWRSLVGIDGSPMEYSWKWNTTTSEPDIRYSWEPINKISGTALDPLNHSASLEYMFHVPTVVSDVDFTWAHHFLANLFDHDLSKYAKEFAGGTQPATTFLHAVEYVRSGIGLKSYFVPRKLGQRDPLTIKQWDEAIVKLNPNNAGRDTLMEFLTRNPEGQLFKPVILAMDDVAPSKSRLKLYFTTPHTSFLSVREIMTMGGLIDVPETGMQDLRSFIAATLGLPDDYPEDAEIPSEPPGGKKWALSEALVDGYVYYFDIAPHNKVPGIKFYNPTRRYGPDDLAIAKGLMNWLKARGRGAYCDNYLRMMESVAEHRGLENGKGMHTYISYMFDKNGEPDIKSYIGPEAYHPARF
ncbi:dimethylallyl tryptophan synthase GliD1, partial [Biscogniauxia marginata]